MAVASLVTSKAWITNNLQMRILWKLISPHPLLIYIYSIYPLTPLIFLFLQNFRIFISLYIILPIYLTPLHKLSLCPDLYISLSGSLSLCVYISLIKYPLTWRSITASTSLAQVAWEMTYAPKDPGPRLAATWIVFNVSRTKGLKPIISEKKMKVREKEKEEINKWNKRKEESKGVWRKGNKERKKEEKLMKWGSRFIKKRRIMNDGVGSGRKRPSS